jgi:hypothetical protein
VKSVGIWRCLARSAVVKDFFSRLKFETDNVTMVQADDSQFRALREGDSVPVWSWRDGSLGRNGSSRDKI